MGTFYRLSEFRTNASAEIAFVYKAISAGQNIDSN